MNGGFQKFIVNIGIMCETWLVIYNKFIASGLGKKAALIHTKMFMSSVLEASLNQNAKKNEEGAE